MLEKLKQIFCKKQEQKELTAEEKFDELFNNLEDTVLNIEFGEDFFDYGNEAKEWIWEVRDDIKLKTGFIIPLVRVVGNDELQSNQLLIKIREKIVYCEFLIPTETEFKKILKKGLEEICNKHLQEVFTNELTEKYIYSVQKNNSYLIWNITSILSVIDIKTILFELLKKGRSINNIDNVFEKIGEQILSDGNYRECGKKYNPILIAKSIDKYL